MASSVPASTSSDYSYTSNETKNLRLINQANLTNNVAGLGGALGTRTYASIKSAVKLQQLIPRLATALFTRLRALSAWVRAHPYRAISILSGITILGLTFALPLILQLAGFRVLGPIAGSMAAAWQSSLGLVAAGTPFAILQSAAMGGAAMGVMTGLGALISGVTIVAALTLKKRMIGGVLRGCREVVGGGVEKVKGFWGYWRTQFRDE